MQFLFHTDFLLNALEGTDESTALLDLCQAGKLDGWLLPHSLPVLVRAGEGSQGKLDDLLKKIGVLTLTKKELVRALSEGGKDFETACATLAVQAHRLGGVVCEDPSAFPSVTAYTPRQAAEKASAPTEVKGAPLLNIPASYPEILNDVEDAVAEVVRTGHFIMGPKVAELEAAIAEYCQCQYAVGVSSGTDALIISLMAADIGPGDEVITTPYTFFATVGSISRVGAKPVMVDIDPVTFNIDPAQLENKITQKTKAILPVHLYGQSADMDPILDIAKKHGLTVIEDAAQSIGTEYKKRRAGSMGDYGCFSFFPTKNLGGFGDGGIVTTQTEENYEKLKVLRVHGSKPKYYHRIVGGNFRLDTLQAAVVWAKLQYLEGWTAGRRENADRYTALIKENGLSDRVTTPQEQFPRHIYNQYVIRAGSHRDALREHLKSKSIGNEIYYPLPLHMQECFAELGYKKGDFPVSETAAEETLALPISQEITAEQQEYVVQAIREYFDRA